MLLPEQPKAAETFIGKVVTVPQATGPKGDAQSKYSNLTQHNLLRQGMWGMKDMV